MNLRQERGKLERRVALRQVTVIIDGGNWRKQRPPNRKDIILKDGANEREYTKSKETLGCVLQVGREHPPGRENIFAAP